MNENENGPQVLESPRDRHESARGGAAPKVAHPSDNAQQGPMSAMADTPETDEVAAIRDYWQAAKARYKRGDFPDYASAEWMELPLEDPRKMAGLVAFAQLWLRYGDEIAADLNQQLRAPYELVHRATPEACAKAFRDLAAQQQHRKEAA